MGIIEFLRQFRIGPFTIFDSAAAYIGIFLVSPVLNWVLAKMHLRISVIGWLWLTLPIGIIFHLIFNQSTPMMKMLLNPNGDYITKIVLVLMLFMGLRQVKIQK